MRDLNEETQFRDIWAGKDSGRTVQKMWWCEWACNLQFGDGAVSQGDYEETAGHIQIVPRSAVLKFVVLQLLPPPLVCFWTEDERESAALGGVNSMGAKGFVRDAWQAGGRGGGVHRCGAAEVAPPLEEVKWTKWTVTAYRTTRCAQWPEVLRFSCTRCVKCPVHQMCWKSRAPSTSEMLASQCNGHRVFLGGARRVTQNSPTARTNEE